MRRALLLIGLSACAPPSLNIGVDVPAEIDWVAGLALDDAGRVIGGTGLVPAHSLQSQLVVLSEDDERAARVAVIGWSEATLLDAMGRPLPSPELMARSPLLPAEPTQPIMPPPDLYAETNWPGPGYGVKSPAPATLEVHTVWLPSCPNLIAEGRPLIDSCSGFYCGDLFTQVGCAVDLDTSGCLQGGPTHLSVGPRGELSGTSNNVTCEPVRATAPSNFAFSCKDCTFEAHRPPFFVPFEASAPIQVVTVSDPMLRRFPNVYASNGPLLGIVSLPPPAEPCAFSGPRIVALTREDPEDCGSPQALVAIDPDTLAVLGRAAVTRSCARSIFPDPIGGGVLIAFDHNLTLERFGCDLTPLASAALAIPGFEAGVLDSAVYLVGAGPQPPRIIVAVAHIDGAALAEIDPVSLGVSRTFFDTGIARVSSMGAFGPARAVLGARQVINDIEVVRVMDFSTDPPGNALSLPNFGAKLSEVATSVTGLPRTEVLVSSSPKTAPENLAVVRIGVPGDILRLEAPDYTIRGSSPSGSYPWRAPPSLAPDAEDLVLIATTLDSTEPSPETRIGLLDVKRAHFLPARIKIGFGPVGQIVEDGSGALWLPLTWQGAIVRVRPSAPQLVRDP